MECSLQEWKCSCYLMTLPNRRLIAGIHTHMHTHTPSFSETRQHTHTLSLSLTRQTLSLYIFHTPTALNDLLSTETLSYMLMKRVHTNTVSMSFSALNWASVQNIVKMCQKLWKCEISSSFAQGSNNGIITMTGYQSYPKMIQCFLNDCYHSKNYKIVFSCTVFACSAETPNKV